MIAKLDSIALRAAFPIKMLFAIVFVAVSGVAFAQTPPCMPGGSCCINGTCGTLEQFKRNATIVCLQADAIENKSLPQSIELAGRCTAAQIMAERVEGTQQANAKEHQQALDAQRKLREMGAPLPQQALSQPPQDAMVVAQNEMVAAIAECRNKRINGELKSFVASAECANPRIIQAFRRANYRYMDLIEDFNTKRLQISERVDRRKLTETDAKIETQKLFASIVEAERQRDSMRK
ncbi:hypothetical protein [Bradyrhizobium sp.]|uniref:hypothetical protein n=1 Tax=Bradyrhizobium sp. TaxID=376 RepID=UPI002601B25A|nr:hypothetical protein [Bradyrhizobium sp.]